MPDTAVTTDSPTNPPPDWNNHPDLLCPLCEYNLRGLTTARCPECGFAFQWQELLDAEKNKHKYLFEHGSGQNLKSFWKTYWRTCRPRRFWRDLNPAQPVHLLRLMVYWILIAGIAALCMSNSNITQFIQATRTNFEIRSRYASGGSNYWGQAQVKTFWPLPWEVQFWTPHFGGWQRTGGLGYYYPPFLGQPGVGWGILLLLWPWLTLISLLIFRLSMRQAKIRTIHLLRTVIYSCDFGLLLLAALMAMSSTDIHVADGWLLLTGAIVCATITTYRLTIAFEKYLRVHLPLATVLATQVIVVLAVFLALVPIADFTRRV